MAAPETCHQPLTAAAALTQASLCQQRLPCKWNSINIATDFNLTKGNMATVYLLPNPYYDAFKQPLNLQKLDITQHPTAGLDLYKKDGRVHLKKMTAGLPAAKIPNWQSRFQGAWLIKIGNTTVTSAAHVTSTLTLALASHTCLVTLLFAHPEIRPNLAHDGIPIVLSTPFTMAAQDQLNLRWEFTTVANFLWATPPRFSIVDSGEVKCVVTRVIKLTHGKLLKQSDWTDWQDSEYLQLNQYFDQGMFGTPHIPNNKDAIFFLV